MMKKRIKTSILSLFLTLILIVTTICCETNAFAAFSGENGSVCTAENIGYYIGADGKYYGHGADGTTVLYKYMVNGASDKEYWEHSFYIDLEVSGSKAGVWSKYFIKNSSGNKQVYCIQAGSPFDDGNNYTAFTENGSNYFRDLPTEVKRGIKQALIYGYTEGKSVPVSGCNADDYAFATQIIIWEYQQGIRTTATSRQAVTVNNSDPGKSGTIPADMFYNMLKGRPAEQCYNWILGKINNHGNIPSFTYENLVDAANNAYTLRWNGTNQRYEITLTDGNNTEYAISTLTNNGISGSKDGNLYTFYSANKVVNMPSGYKKKINENELPFLIWETAGGQTVCTGVSDPVQFYISFQSESDGSIKIIKTAEDGQISNVSFQISGNGIATQTVTTANDGTITVNGLKPGTYIVTELNPADKYVAPASQNITVTEGNTATVTFSNNIKKGNLIVQKASEDGVLQGIIFKITGTSTSGLTVERTATTDANGIATFNDVYVGTYTLTEVNTSSKYVVPSSQNVTINYNQTTNANVSNVLKKWKVSLTKSDENTGNSQGNATLAGAKYGIYQNGNLLDTYTTDSDGKFTTNEYVCGSGYTLKEIEAPEGYLIDNTVYPIGAESTNYTIEHNTIPVSVTDKVIKGKVLVVKHADNGDTQIETPEVGAQFEVYLKSAGSYDAAADTLRDLITADEDGFAESKELPYGVYTIHQISGFPDVEFIGDFDVFISENAKIYKYLVNNNLFESYLKISKLDAETGLMIPVANTGFELYNSDGAKIVMKYIYPELTETDVFYTNADGYLITPEKLAPGTYKLVEVAAPYGYVLDSTPVDFTITKDVASTENGLTIITISKENVPQKGNIIINKTGSSFESVNKTENSYIPVFSLVELSGAEFDIIATEDIKTPEGTLRYSKGEIVDHVCTDSDGKAVSSNLYLGKYIVRETKAPNGYVKVADSTVELTYAGETVEITEQSVNIINERQKAKIKLTKSLEDSKDNVTSVCFGLYAAEDITAEDGSIIAKDGLIETKYANKNGDIIFETDIPFGKYYVKEIKTVEGYVIDETKYYIAFEYAGSDMEVVEILVNEGKTIVNIPQKGNIIINKTGSSFESVNKTENGYVPVFSLVELPGAEFDIIAAEDIKTPDGTLRYSKNEIVDHVCTGEDGKAVSSNLYLGKYTVRETKTPYGYVKAADSTVELTYAGETVEITEQSVNIINERQKARIKLTKSLEDSKDNVTSVCFGLYAAEDITAEDGSIIAKDGLIETKYADKNGDIIFETDIPFGKYYVKEIKTVEGYIIDESKYYIAFEYAGSDTEVVEILVNEGNAIVNKKDSPPEDVLTGENTKTNVGLIIIFLVAAAIIGLNIWFAKKKDNRRR